MYSKVVQLYIYIYLFFFFKFLSRLGCYIKLSKVPCAIQYVFVGCHFKYSSVYMSIPNSLTIPPRTVLPGNGKFFSKAVSLCVLSRVTNCLYILFSSGKSNEVRRPCWWLQLSSALCSLCLNSCQINTLSILPHQV